MTFNDYINKQGFERNPFQHTNADKEKDFLENYFIEPDYFEDVWGDPQNPVSNIVYAPRGGGKTAQRLMIEKRARKYDEILVITYTDHDLENYNSASEIGLSYHLEYLNRLMLLSFFNRLHSLDEFDYLFEFNFTERQYIYKLCRGYFNDTPKSFPRQAINSLKTIEDHGVDLWNKFKSPINDVIKLITKSKGFEVDFSKIEIDKDLKASHRENFLNIKSFINRLGISTIYVLVDKVDEQSLTGNDPKLSYDLISSLIKDLELLETDGMGFKFFLWDELKPLCAAHARPDRVFSYSLKWSFGKLIEMMDKRIAAYSKNNKPKANELFYYDISLGRIILFSEFSPRDVIRLCNRIFSEQFKNNPKSMKIRHEIVNQSIDKFCRERAAEIATTLGLDITLLAKFNRASFTRSHLLESLSAEENYILETLSVLNSSKFLKLINKSSNINLFEYAFTDIRLARIACNSMNLDDFTEAKVRDCIKMTCGKFNYRDFDRNVYECSECGSQLNELEVDDLPKRKKFSKSLDDFEDSDDTDDTYYYKGLKHLFSK